MKPLFTPVLCALLAYALYFAGLGAIGLVGPDEPRYADVARAMMRTGDYVTPRLFGSPWFEKPPLYYWLAAFSFHLGVNEINARLPSAVFACGFLGLWFWFSRRLFGQRAAALATILLASSLGWVGFARAAAMDMLLSTTLGAALVFLGLWFWETRPFQLYLFYGLLAAATLAKGPLAVALAGMLGLGYVAATGEWKKLRGILGSPALGLFAALAVPWYLFCWQRNGYAFVEEFFLKHNWQRLVSAEAIGHPQPVWFYLPVVAAGLFPWTPLLLLPAAQLWRERWKAVFADRRMLFLVLWVALPFLFFSLSRNKLPGYLLPVLPPLTLWIARIAAGGLAEDNSPSRQAKTVSQPQGSSLAGWLLGLSALLLLLAPLVGSLLAESLATGLGHALESMDAAAVGRQITTGRVPLLLWLGLAALVSGSLYQLWRRRALAGAFLALAGVALSMMAITEYLGPVINRTASVRAVAARLQSLEIQPGEVAVYGIHRNQAFGLSYYLELALPEWSPGAPNPGIFFVVAEADAELAGGRPLTLFPGPRLRLWAMLESPRSYGSGGPEMPGAGPGTTADRTEIGAEGTRSHPLVRGFGAALRGSNQDGGQATRLAPSLHRRLVV